MIKKPYDVINPKSIDKDPVPPKESLYYTLKKEIGDEYTYTISDFDVVFMKDSKAQGELMFTPDYIEAHKDERVYFIWFHHTKNYHPDIGIWYHPERIMLEGPQTEIYKDGPWDWRGKKKIYVKSMKEAIEIIKNSIEV